MTQIKICGITNVEDALAAEAFGADAVGFVFAENSPRYIEPEAAAAICVRLKTVRRVGVFVNRDAEEVKAIQKICRLDLLQFHGDESPSYCRAFPSSILIKAVSGEQEADPELLQDYPVRAFLVDGRTRGLRGGTGKTADWSAAREIGRLFHLILAGGLHPGNIEEALRGVRPDAVDIASGVESSPGRKDHSRMQELIRTVHTWRAEGTRPIFCSLPAECKPSPAPAERKNFDQGDM